MARLRAGLPRRGAAGDRRRLCRIRHRARLRPRHRRWSMPATTRSCCAPSARCSAWAACGWAGPTGRRRWSTRSTGCAACSTSTSPPRPPRWRRWPSRAGSSAAVAHNTEWRARLSAALEARRHQGLAEPRQFHPRRFRHRRRAPRRPTHSCAARGIIVRGMAAYDLPHCLRITIGTGEECTAGGRAAGRFHVAADRRRMAEPLFRRLALLGIGLIGSSVARVGARARRPRRPRWWPTRAAQATLDRVRELGIADRVELDPARAVEGADCVMLCAPVGAYAALAAGDRAASGAGLHPDRCRLDQAVGDPRRRAAGAGRACISCRRIRWPAPSIPGPDAGFATLFEGRWCLLTPPPGTDAGGGGAGRRVLAALRLDGVESWSRPTTTGCWRSSATCRI